MHNFWKGVEISELFVYHELPIFFNKCMLLNNGGSFQSVSDVSIGEEEEVMQSEVTVLHWYVRISVNPQVIFSLGYLRAIERGKNGPLPLCSEGILAEGKVLWIEELILQNTSLITLGLI